MKGCRHEGHYDAPFLVAAAIFMLANPAAAQKHCYPAAVLETYLMHKYQEVQTTTALTNRSPATWIEVWVSPGGATWSVVELSHHGIRCLLRAGEGWRQVTKKRGQPM